MKRKILSIILACFLVIQLSPVLLAAQESKPISITITKGEKTITILASGKTSTARITEKAPMTITYDTLADALADLTDGKLSTEIGSTASAVCTIADGEPCVIMIDCQQYKQDYEEKINKKVVFSSGGTVGQAEDEETIQVNFPEVIIRTNRVLSQDRIYHNTITFQNGIDVNDGAKVALENTSNGVASSTINYKFGAPVIVSGSLEFAGNSLGSELNVDEQAGAVEFSESAKLKINAAGNVTIGSVVVTGKSTDPLIDVQSGGELTISAPDGCSFGGSITAVDTAIWNNGGTLNLDSGSITTYSTDKPLIESNGGTVNLKKTQDMPSGKSGPVIKLTAPADAPAILATNSATLMVETGEVTSDSEQPAIVIESGSIKISNDTARGLIPSVTSAGKDAVDLSAGVTVTNAVNVSATVSKENADVGDNYIDNYGNIILAKGATTGEGADVDTLNAAVILPDGTIIQGSSTEAPTLSKDENGNTIVKIPEKGSVTEPDEKTQNLVAGGTVTSTTGSDGRTTTQITENTIAVTGVTLNKSDLSLIVGGSETLKATVSPDNATNTAVTWSTSDAAVATVNNGKVTAKAAGTATITVTTTDGSKTATCNITVTVPVDNVKLDNATLSLIVGDSETLKATVSPADATDKAVTWTSSDKTVVTVDETGKVTAKGEGTATITAAAGEKTATCTVKVVTPSYAVSVPAKVANGVVLVSPESAKQGEVVTITAIPDKGYEVGEIVVTDKNGKKIKLTDKGDGKYTFDMPASKVNIEVSFVKEAHVCPSAKFTDVDITQYYHEAIDWAVINGVTEGTSATAFSPNASCTRAQMVTFLWRAAGSPEVNYGIPFTDVDEDAYYAEAVRWAVNKGITKGTSATTFSPETFVTRAQVVTFLYRYAEEPVIHGTNSFTDVVAGAYYVPAVKWAVKNGITVGTSETTFSPESDCTRAQCVTFLYRDLAE